VDQRELVHRLGVAAHLSDLREGGVRLDPEGEEDAGRHRPRPPDDDFDAELQRLADESHRTKSDVAREMLRRQLQVALFEQVRERIAPYAEAAGYLTDEDVFRDVS